MKIPSSEAEVYFSIDHAGDHVDQLMSSTDADVLLESVEFLKNVAIGSNKQKEAIMEKNLLPRFLFILQNYAPTAVTGNVIPDMVNEELLCETTSAINSLAKGSEDQVKSLINAGVVPILLNLLMSNMTSSKHTAIILRTLSSLFKSKSAPHSLIYEWTGPDGSQTLLERLLSLASPPPSLSSSASQNNNPYPNQEAVCLMLSHSIMEYPDRQRSLSSMGIIPILADLIMSPCYFVQIAALQLLANMTFNNMEVSKIVVTTIPTSRYNQNTTRLQTAFQTVPDILTEMMSQEGTLQMQLLAAKCMTYLYRSEVICAEDKRIVYKTLPTLVRCCKDPNHLTNMDIDSSPGHHTVSSSDNNQQCVLSHQSLSDAASRAQAADMLAFLTETDTQLQQIAATCDQVIVTIADLLKFQANTGISSHCYPCCSGDHHHHADASPVASGAASSSSASATASTAAASGGSSAPQVTAAAARRLDQGAKIQNEMRQSAFKVFASLAANDEEVRKRILELDSMMDHVVSGLNSPEPGIRLAALKCLHSLSRSVQQFKQHFPEAKIWPALKSLLSSPQENVTLLASSTLCNLLLEMSSAKAHFIDKATLDSLAGLTRRSEVNLRINGVWALMNMVHKADQVVKMQILSTLTMDGIFKLLHDESEKVVLKTLGLLRNLLTTKAHIDHIMSLHGKDIIDSLIMIIDSLHQSVDVKEQAFCVIANIADGDASKDLIMTNDEILNRLLAILEEGMMTMSDDPLLLNPDISSSIDHVVGKRPITKLQIAVTYCITNLVWAGEDGSAERQARMKDIGILKCLNQLVESSDTDLFHKVKTALQQFPNKNN